MLAALSQAAAGIYKGRSQERPLNIEVFSRKRKPPQGGLLGYLGCLSSFLIGVGPNPALASAAQRSASVFGLFLFASDFSFLSLIISPSF
jgi:hypothetical protein